MITVFHNVAFQFCKHFGRCRFLLWHISNYFQVWAKFHWDDQRLRPKKMLLLLHRCHLSWHLHSRVLWYSVLLFLLLRVKTCPERKERGCLEQLTSAASTESANIQYMPNTGPLGWIMSKYIWDFVWDKMKTDRAGGCTTLYYLVKRNLIHSREEEPEMLVSEFNCSRKM